ncbi:cation diffusion facilitator family transporter [Tundrisphaera sp. TA3]|uniref:cation diffusion facilitator family transporter n=1 Tax=Tundrisphaera sp. TA3 TaxID=3435775 RepID=UPI003EBEB347
MSQHPDTSSRRWAALLSLGVGVLMLAGKWVAYLLTGSNAILSDALESVVHVAATAFAFASIVLNARPPDAAYPYGYGKISYFSAGFEGALIALAGAVIVYEAGDGLIHGAELTRLDAGMAIILAASVANLALGLYLLRAGKRSNSLILIADGHHVLADSYTSFGVVLGVGLVLATGLTWLDGVVALIVGVNILWTGYGLVREGFSGLMDRADPSLLDRIVSALQAGRQPGWIDIHLLRAWQAGDRTFVDFHLVVPEDWTVGLLHEANHACDDLLRAALGDAAEVNIHFDPDRPGAYDARRPWTVATAIRQASPAREAAAPAGPGRTPEIRRADPLPN